MGKLKVIGSLSGSLSGSSSRFVGFGVILLILSGCATQFSQPTSAACLEFLELAVASESSEDTVESSESPATEHLDCTIGPNDRYAMSLFGQYHLQEAKSEEDYKAAARFLKAAAMPSSGYSQIYVAGFGSVPASVQSIKTGPTTSGDSQAQYLLGWIYANGLTGKFKEGKARKWLKRAASQGHGEAISLLQTLTTQEG